MIIRLFFLLRESYVTTKIPADQRAVSLAILGVTRNAAEGSADFLYSNYLFQSKNRRSWLIGLPFYVAYSCIFMADYFMIRICRKLQPSKNTTEGGYVISAYQL